MNLPIPCTKSYPHPYPHAGSSSRRHSGGKLRKRDKMPKGILYTGDFVKGHSRRDASWGYWYCTKLIHIRPQKKAHH